MSIIFSALNITFSCVGCGHCKKTEPEFSKAATNFKDDTKIEFAAVDCTIQQQLCTKNDVQGYPTIKYFSYYSKVVVRYTGGRKVSTYLQNIRCNKMSSKLFVKT